MRTMISLSPKIAGSTTLVVLAGGEGRRFGGPLAKHLRPLHSVPLVVRLLGQLAGSFTRTPVVVIHENDVDTARVLDEWGVQVRLVIQKSGGGSVPAILDALPLSAAHVFVALGDLVMDGEVPAVIDREPAIVVWPAAPKAALRANYGVEVDSSTVRRVIEKPQQTGGLVCGMGLYLLRAELVRSFARGLPGDDRGERGVTDLLATMVDRDVQLNTCTFEGTYVNVNRPEDLAVAARAIPTTRAILKDRSLDGPWAGVEGIDPTTD